MKKKLRWLLGILLVIALVTSGYRIVQIMAEYAQTEAARQEAIDRAVVLADEALPAAAVNPAEGLKGAAEAAPPAETPPITVDFGALHESNPEIVGWLYCADTNINYPVAQTDDNTYYLNHLYNGKSGRSGTLFVDCACSPDFSDRNTVIYGHHMKSGSMFASIVEYHSQEYYEAHPVMYLLTPEENYRLDIFGGYVVESGSQRLFSLDEEAGFIAYLEEIRELSDFTADVDVTPKDRIVTLATCTYEYDGARYLLFAAMTAIG